MRFYSLAVCFITCLSFLHSPLFADELLKLQPEERLMRGGGGLVNAAESVEYGKVGNKDWPENVHEQVASVVLGCTGKIEDAKLVKLSSYSSSYHREKELAPNYVADFSALSEKAAADPEKCKSICREESCLLRGYRSVAEGFWQPDFDLYVTSFSFDEKTNDQGNTSTRIKTISTDCTGEERSCKKDYIWRTRGLMPAD